MSQILPYESLCKDVIELVKKAGSFISKEALTFDLNSIEVKGKHDLVSYVDKQAEEILVAGLIHLLPEAGFITEEKTINKKGKTHTWIIDPLDGTTNFIHGLPVYSVSVALMEDEQLVMGVVYELNRDELFYAWKGSPAYLNGKVIRVSPESALNNSLIATGFPYTDFKEIDSYLQLMKHMMMEARGLRRLGSAAVDLAYVACGRYESYFEFNINSYDIAGGVFVLQQAGGKITTFSGSEHIPSIFESREVLASNNHIHAEMLNSIKTHFTTTQE